MPGFNPANSDAVFLAFNKHIAETLKVKLQNPRAPKFAPSSYQEAIYRWVEQGSGNAAVNAVAGSGKTTTLEGVAARIQGVVQVQTVHSAGYQAVRSVHRYAQVDGNKYGTMAKEAVQRAIDTHKVLGQPLDGTVVDALYEEWPVGTISRLVDLVRLTLSGSDLESLVALDNRFGLEVDYDLWPFVSAVVPALLRYGREDAAQCVDFTDMVWLPAIDRQFNPRTYDWVLIDEAQDLNAAQRSLVGRMLRPTGRLLAVGDPKQAIYGFAGADPGSFEQVVADFDCQEFPLSICYRCPSSHLDLARALVPQIEARPSAPVGTVMDVDDEYLRQELRATDIILCRVTAPLIGLAYELIRSGIPAQVKGRDIGQGLVTVCKKVAKMRGYSWPKFEDFLDEWSRREQAKVVRKGGDEAVQRVTDKVDSIFAIYDATTPATFDDLCRAINALFSDNGDNMVTLSTIHRAKGLEADRIWFLAPELCPHPMARQDWQREQEWNLRYVALTRSMDALFFIPDRERAPRGRRDESTDDE